MNGIKVMAIGTLTGGAIGAAGTGIAISRGEGNYLGVTDSTAYEILLGAAVGATAGLVLSAFGLLAQRIRKACAKSKAPSLLMSDEESLMSDDSDKDSICTLSVVKIHQQYLRKLEREEARSDESTPIKGVVQSHFYSGETTFYSKDRMVQSNFTVVCQKY